MHTSSPTTEASDPIVLSLPHALISRASFSNPEDKTGPLPARIRIKVSATISKEELLAFDSPLAWSFFSEDLAQIRSGVRSVSALARTAQANFGTFQATRFTISGDPLPHDAPQELSIDIRTSSKIDLVLEEDGQNLNIALWLDVLRTPLSLQFISAYHERLVAVTLRSRNMEEDLFKFLTPEENATSNTGTTDAAPTDNPRKVPTVEKAVKTAALS